MSNQTMQALVQIAQHISESFDFLQFLLCSPRADIVIDPRDPVTLQALHNAHNALLDAMLKAGL